MNKIVDYVHFSGFIVSALGIVFLTITTIIKIIRKKKRINCTGKAEGTVVENKLVTEHRMEMDECYEAYYSRVNFEASGKTHTFQSNISGAKPLHKIGDIVTVYYNPEKPEEFFIEEEQHMARKITHIFEIIGISLFIIGIGIIICS